ncbi:hypothetical protein BN2476_280058 [Paraburkholderia piptadeniae]|uniref:Uncharacterized protein n=1 Tax=Paraburkholderia piptadeniae TaxID=1701573 RepID=A0A1N7S1U8_9BURK|nr:hypothetical protein BN2476_280058 [Paraburkholderia piptadeniae]
MNVVVKDAKAASKAEPKAAPEAQTKAQAPGAQPQIDLLALLRKSGIAGVPDELDRGLAGLAPVRTRIREIVGQRLIGRARDDRARRREANRLFADVLSVGARADPDTLTLLTPPISARAACSPNLSVTRQATPPNPSYPLCRRASCVTQTLR